MPYKSEVKPWAEFNEIRGEKFTDFDIVKSKISELTEKVAGKKSGIVNDPIKLNIYSNSCPDLTVIDLPGITKIPLKGNIIIIIKTKDLTSPRT